VAGAVGQRRKAVELGLAKAIAEQLKTRLQVACHRIEIAGSVRRQKPDVGDIELLVIPRGNMLEKELHDMMMENVLAMRLNKRGNRAYGPKNKLMVHLPSGIGVDIFSTDEQCWPVALVVRTGGEKTNRRIAMAAIRMGWHLKAYGWGFATPQGEVVCHSEREVFEFVGLTYLPPEKRE
jgi:DNA polymerase/3'-5' exonuclease PolX